jgi:hypothetical protein
LPDPVEIVVQLREDVARGVSAREPEGEADDVRRRADELGVSIEPMHPGESDPLLTPYFVVQAPGDDAPRIAEELSALPGVEAAYVKPAAELP